MAAQQNNYAAGRNGDALGAIEHMENVVGKCKRRSADCGEPRWHERRQGWQLSPES
jgi:hypothetical protein